MDILENQLDIHLIRLSCNVHPLDTIASDSLKCLVTLEKEINLKSAFGKEGAAVTFIYNLSKLRLVLLKDFTHQAICLIDFFRK